VERQVLLKRKSVEERQVVHWVGEVVVQVAHFPKHPQVSLLNVYLLVGHCDTQ
jgi:hypothetical protein